MTAMAVDLFGWRELRMAEAAVAAAHARQAEALRRFRCAPHGEKTARHAALTAATAESLRAEAELAAVQREAGL